MFQFADLFAGIGGFHAAMHAMGGQGWFASEIDRLAAGVYERNWGIRPHGDIVPITEHSPVGVPAHDILAGGFPCQPFSKSGYQRGMDEARGTLFWNICRVLQETEPTVVVLENVRNLAGPRHRHEWEVIVKSLRELGYRVSDTPTVFSPHLLPPDQGGRPQVRERVFVVATYVGADRAMRETDVRPTVENRPVGKWSPSQWDLNKHLLDTDDESHEPLRLTDAELMWLEVWNDFLRSVGKERLPGFPIWADEFRWPAVIPEGTADWKANFLRKNAEYYRENAKAIDAWKRRHNNLAALPPSRRKLEWQAQDSERDLFRTVLHLRPSGIRAKRPTYLPALVAITQTSIVGARGRRISPKEAARLQGLPDWFDFGDQPQAATYRQLGNGVNVGAAYHVLREHILANRDDIALRAPWIVEAVEASSANPDDVLKLGLPSELAQHRAARPLAVGGGQEGSVTGVQPVLAV